MQIIAHRGASGKYLENTIEAFELAYKEGADYVELDIQQTIDDFLVVFHDSHFKDGVNISDMTYKEFKKRTEELKIPAPLFKDVLHILDGKVGINIEIKRLFNIDLLLSICCNYPKDKLLFSSFNHVIVGELVRKDPKALTGTLMVSKLIDPIVCMRSLQSNILIQHYGFVDEAFVKFVQKHKYKIFVWTVNYEPDIYWFIKLGVDGIFTDYPGRVKKILNKFK